MQSFDALLAALSWIPDWLWVAIGAVAVGAWVKFFGWRGALPALVGVLSLGLLVKTRKQGWEAREKKGAEHVAEMLKKSREAREKVRADHAADPGKLRDDDGYRRDK